MPLSLACAQPATSLALYFQTLLTSCQRCISSPIVADAISFSHSTDQLSHTGITLKKYFIPIGNYSFAEASERYSLIVILRLNNNANDFSFTNN